MAEKTEYTANTGLVNISTGNSNLDGTSGAYGTLLTAASNGTMVKTIIIKAERSTGQGMIRFFIHNSDTNLILEVPVPYIDVSDTSKDMSFQAVIPFNYSMKSGDVLKVSTQVGDSFNIFAEGFDWIYRTDVTPEYTANTGGNTLAAVNTEYLIFTAGSLNGCEISSIIFKALETTDTGLVKLYLQDDDTGHTKFLFFEASVPYVKQSGSTASFSLQIITQGSLTIQQDYHIYAAATVNVFGVSAFGNDWQYV